MNKDKLIVSAHDLIQPDPQIADEYSQKKEKLATRLIDNLGQRTDLDKLIGSDNRAMMKDNAYNMARFMESMFTQYDAAVFVETILWVFRAYRSHGFQLTFWSAHLNTWMEVIQEELTEQSAGGILPFYEWIQTHIPVFTALTDDNEGKIEP